MIAAGCTWRSDKVTTAAKARYRAAEHFNVCPTNRRAIQEAKERQEEEQHRMVLEVAKQARDPETQLEEQLEE